MSATIVVDSLAYARKLEQAGFSRQQAEAQAEVFQEQGERLRAALQPILAFYEEATRKDLATRGDVLDTRLEIEKVRADLKSDIETTRVEVEKVRADLTTRIEQIRAELKSDIETTRAEVEKVRADLTTRIEQIRAELKSDIESTRAEVEKVRADLTTRIEQVSADLRTEIEKVRAEVEKVRVDVEKSKYALLKWQIGIGLTLLTVMARGFGWIG